MLGAFTETAKKIIRPFALGFLTLLVLVGAPRVAHAQFIVADPALIGIGTTEIVKDSTKDLLVGGATAALLSGVNYFVSQLAYQAAVALTSECPGQIVCWDSKSFQQGIREAAQGAAGEAIGTLSDQAGFTKLGFNLCAPPTIPALPGLPEFNGPQFTLNLQLGLLDELKPPAPKCDFSQLASNWTAVRDSLTSQELLGEVKSLFDPGQSPLSVALSARNAVKINITQQATSDATNQRLIDASAGGGFSSIIDPISKRIKAPASTVLEEFKNQKYLQNIAPQNAANAYASGQLASKAVATVVPTALSTFGQTLLSRLWNKLADGLLSTEALIAAQPDLILNEDGILQPPGVIGARIAQSLFLSSAPRDIGVIDPLLEFTTCPSSRGLKNCVVDAQFANAIRVADAAPVTVRDAIEKNLLHGDWPLISSINRAKDQDPFCYTSAYCESNLKKLRAARIISIGWEIAAHKSPIDKPVKLKDIVDGFNDCNDQGQQDADHPWCHLIDPDWVIKIPATQCRAQVYGPQLVAPSIANRGETCSDAPTCLRQDDAGNCIGGWGYCTREKNTWRFNGDSCPAEFNSCRTLTQTEGGAQVNLLLNTVGYGSCTSDNAGCARYSVQETINSNPADPTDDWQFGAARFLTRKAENCSPNDGGCTQVFALGQSGSLNLIRNGSFERLSDGDLDGTPDHADGWYPYGEIPTNRNGALSRDAAKAIDGSISVLLSGTTSGSNSCSLSAGAICDQESGCTCKTATTNGASCTVPFGASSCAIINTVVQDGIPVKVGNAYTLSGVFTNEQAGLSMDASMTLLFRNAANQDIKPLPGQVTITAGIGSDCRVSAEGTLVLQAATSAATLNLSCNFIINTVLPAGSTMGTALILEGNNAFADAIQLEEGNPTPFHDGYGALPDSFTAKISPSYLRCSGEPSDPIQCGQYAPSCKSSEVGCERYIPSNGDPAVPAIISSADRCPAECVGYDSFRQAATRFDVEKFPVHFIPATATACSAAEVGCTEFTNVATEAKAYFSDLRSCQRPEAPDTAIYYSWEGSDTSGFQLRVWSFKQSNVISPASTSPTASDISPAEGTANAGRGPCTNFNGQDGSCIDTAQTVASCNRNAVDAGDFDCREFYDVDGNRHYRLLSKIVVASTDCETFRITTSTQADCSAAGGKWDNGKSECTYAASVGESTSCSVKANGCRAYQGGGSGNVQEVFLDTFETGITGWSTNGAELSPEAVVVGGHSLKIRQGSPRAERNITSLVALNRSYSVTFWARGAGALSVKFDNGASSPSFNFSDADEATPQPNIVLTPQWRQYTLGPVIVATGSFIAGNSFLAFTSAGSGDVFLDNVQLKEVRDSVFAVRDSWNTPVSCDRTLTGIPSPQEMLGCREFRTSTNATVTLRSFGNICREEAVGCSAYSVSQNTPQNFYTETFNARCTLSSACTGNVPCPCNYAERNPAGGSTPIVQPDVCRVPVGQISCAFNLNSAYLPQTPAAVADQVVVPADERRYLVIRAQDRCDATAASCTAMGKQVTSFERTCQNLGSNNQPITCTAGAGCSCADQDANTCLILQGENSCVIPFSQPVVGGWQTVFKKDDPTTYNQTLCDSGSVGCEAFSGTDGQYFFKFDPAQTCEFKESVSFQGETRSGWFRTSTSGSPIPCYPNLVENGDFFEIAKNGDASYQGFVGLCKQEFDRCEEFIDPLETSGTNPNGKPYYYIMNSKLDTQGCSGSVSLKEGCVLFNRTSDLKKNYSTSATYLKSENQRDGTSVSPENCDGTARSGFCAARCSAIRNGVCSNSTVSCNADSQCGGGTCVGDRYFGAGCFEGDDSSCNQGLGETCVKTVTQNGVVTADFTKNDTNLIIKVRPDRECGQWFACSAEQTVFDNQQNKWRNVCTGFDLCEENRQSGNAFECVKWIEPEATLLSENTYANRDITWNGMEYSGYSLVGKYGASLIRPVRIVEDSNGVKSISLFGGNTSSQTISSTRFAALPDPSITCTTDAQCPSDGKGNGTCIRAPNSTQGQCFYEITGGPVNIDNQNNAASCRAYPEIDSPYATTVLQSGDVAGKERLLAFKGANVCGENGEACECSYKRLTYAGSATTKFIGVNSDDTQYPGVCVGGPNNGLTCDPDDADPCGNERGGTCVALESKSTAIGWEGLCLDYDSSISVNGDPNQFACNLWMPVDQIAGSQDVFNQFRTAGFEKDESLLYCQASAGGAVSGNYTQVIANETSGSAQFFQAPGGLAYGGTKTTPLNVNQRDLAGIKIEFIDSRDATPGAVNIEGISRPNKTMYLYPNPSGKNWLNTLTWSGESDTEESTAAIKDGIGNAAFNAQTGAVLGDVSGSGPGGANQTCLNMLGLASGSGSAGEVACDNFDGPFCLAARATPDGSGNIANLQTMLCYNSGALQHDIHVKISLLRREACTVLANVHDPGRTFASAPWTDRLLNPNVVLPSVLNNYERTHQTTRFGTAQDASPFGHGAPGTTAVGSPTYPVYVTEGGSAATTVTPIANDYRERAGNTNAGYPYACDGGGCGQLPGQTTTGGFAPTKTAGQNRLGNIFAVSWLTFDSPAGNPYVAGAAWDDRSKYTTAANTPKVVTVDTFNCSADGACVEGSSTAQGLTVNSSSNGTVEGEGGRLKAVIRYYGYADKDHMPIRRKTVDFFGDGATHPEKLIETTGFYKNHRGVTIQDGKLTPVCNSNTTEWGKNPQSCDTFFFEETKTYLCSKQLASTLQACTGNNYPCRRGDSCVYKPRVQILDNWGVCNGSCGTSGVCMNTVLGTDNGGPTGCGNGVSGFYNANAWTSFAGEIVVHP